jgi:hypothetical protein
LSLFLPPSAVCYWDDCPSHGRTVSQKESRFPKTVGRNEQLCCLSLCFFGSLLPMTESFLPDVPDHLTQTPALPCHHRSPTGMAGYGGMWRRLRLLEAGGISGSKHEMAFGPQDMDCGSACVNGVGRE